MRNKIRKQVSKGICLFTQYKAHLYFEDSNFCLDEKYAIVNNCYFCALFYAPIFPIGLLIFIVVLISYYYISKYVLIKRTKYSNPISTNLNKSMLRVIFYGPLVYSLGSVFYDY